MVRKIFVWGLSCLGLLVLAGALYYGLKAVQQYQTVRETGTFSLSVSGEGTVSVKPDIATVNLTVIAQAPLLKDATSDNNKKNNQVVTFLKLKGIDAKDIKTTLYNVTPQYQVGVDTRPCLMGAPCPPLMPPKIVSYEVTNSLEVKIRNLDTIGAILDGAIGAGANSVNGPVFTVDDEEKTKAEARALAVEQAQNKAKALAKAMGVSLIKISGFAESGGGPIYYAASKAMAGEDIAAPPPAIEPGQNEIKVTVTITYDAK